MEPRLTLIIDDDRGSADVTLDALETIGVTEVKVLSSLDAAKRFLEKERVVFIIVDKDVGGVNSAEFVKWLRSDFDNRNYHVPIIVMGGNPTRRDVAEARDSGATEFMAKPFRIKSLSDIMLNSLKKPRNFIISRNYRGPDRRRRDEPPIDGKKRKDDK